MTGTIFLIVDSAMYNDTLLSDNPIGRGIDDNNSDESDDADDSGDDEFDYADDEFDYADDEYDDDYDDVGDVNYNPFIYREADDDNGDCIDQSNNDEDNVMMDDEDSLMTDFFTSNPSKTSIDNEDTKKRQEKLIEKYVKRMCAQGKSKGRKYSPLVSLEKETIQNCVFLCTWPFGIWFATTNMTIARKWLKR